MTWTRLSDDFADRPDLQKVSRSARLLHVEGLVYSNRHLLEGRVPVSAVRRLSDADGDELEQLLSAGIWERLDDGSLLIPGWVDHEHQEAADVVRKRAQAARDKTSKARERKARHGVGDHGLCHPNYCVARKNHDDGDHEQCAAAWCKASAALPGNDTSNDTGGVTSTQPTPSQPDPSHPRPKGKGMGEGASRCPHRVRLAKDGTGCASCAEQGRERNEARCPTGRPVETDGSCCAACAARRVEAVS